MLDHLQSCRRLAILTLLILPVTACASGSTNAPAVPDVAPCPGSESMEPELLPLGREKEPGLFGPRYVDPNAVPRLMERELTRGQVTETGRVTVRIEVSVSGSVESREIISNTAGNKLGRAAMDIARQLKFHPAERAGCAIPSLVDFELRLGRG